MQAVNDVLRSQWITTGNVAARFEQELAEYLGVEHVISTSSCTAALECALASLHLPPGSTVAVPAWTFVATANVVIRQNLTPLLVDIEPTTLNMAPAALEACIDKVDAVIPVHFAGVPVDASIYGLANDRHLPVLDDAAHALGSQLDRTRGEFAAAYSLYATKNLTSAEGGFVATNSEETARFCQIYRMHGLSRDAWKRYGPGHRATYDVEMPGMKGNLPDLLAALALSQFKRFNHMQERRADLVARYRTNLTGKGGLLLLPESASPNSSNHLFVVLLPEGTDREQVVLALSDLSITTSVHFTPLHHFSGISKLVAMSDELPCATALAPRALSLPLHPQLTEDDVDYVSTCLLSCLEQAGVVSP